MNGCGVVLSTNSVGIAMAFLGKGRVGGGFIWAELGFEAVVDALGGG